LERDAPAPPGQHADIINMSLGGGSFSQAEQDIVDRVRAEGVIIIAAAGNENTSAPSYPAAYDGVVSVSSVGPEKGLAPYSNFGTSIDVAAPGGDLSKDINNDSIGDGVLSTSGDDSSNNDTIQNVYSYYQGTSMACPHVAGVVALMKSVNPTMTPQLFDDLLIGGFITEDLGEVGKDDSFGHGLIDAYKAVLAAEDPSQIPSILVVDPRFINFGNSTSDKTLSVSNSNIDNVVTAQPPTDNADWLTVTTTDVDAEGLGTYTATVNRTDLSEGPYYATISFVSSENTVDVSVTMFVGNVTVAGNAGFHYVLLLDADTYTARYQDEVAVSPINGTYAFNFDAVLEGNYIVFAGTDSDNDFFIGDSGESSGAYISLDQPVVIRVDEDLTGIDFNTSFNLNLPSDLSVGSGYNEPGVRRLENN